MKLWNWEKKSLPSVAHAIRTAVAATVSVMIARLVQMPEAYWAAIATLVVMQSTLGATLTLSLERIVANAIGASVGALETLRGQSRCVRARDRSRRAVVDLISFGEDGVSLRKHHARYHRPHPAFCSGVDDSAAPVFGSLSGHYGRARGRRRMAGRQAHFTHQRCCLTKQINFRKIDKLVAATADDRFEHEEPEASSLF